jgi:hypothetical protein
VMRWVASMTVNSSGIAFADVTVACRSTLNAGFISAASPKRLCRHVLGRTTDLKWRCPICIVRESQQYPSFRRRQALSMIVDSIHISWRNTEEMYQSVFTEDA